MPSLTFRPMGETDFDEYLKEAIVSYGAELESIDMVPKGSGEKAAEQQFEQALPQGIKTKNFYFFNAYNERQQHIGLVIYGQRNQDEAFIMDLQIFETHRQKGYGKQVMLDIEKHAKERGFKRMSLHVFGHNKSAWGLYKKLGYEETSLQMSKHL